MRIEKNIFFFVADFFFSEIGQLQNFARPIETRKSLEKCSCTVHCRRWGGNRLGISGIACEDLSCYVVIRNTASNCLQQFLRLFNGHSAPRASPPSLGAAFLTGLSPLRRSWTEEILPCTVQCAGARNGEGRGPR